MSALAARTLSRGIDAITARPTSTFTPASAASARVIRPRRAGSFWARWLGNPRGGRGKKAARPERIRASRSTTTCGTTVGLRAPRDAFLGRRERRRRRPRARRLRPSCFFENPCVLVWYFFVTPTAQAHAATSVSHHRVIHPSREPPPAPARVAFILSMSAAPRRPSPRRTAPHRSPPASPSKRSRSRRVCLVVRVYFPPALFRGGVLGRDPIMLPNPPMSLRSAGFNIWKLHIKFSSTVIIAPALSNSPQ